MINALEANKIVEDFEKQEADAERKEAAIFQTSLEDQVEFEARKGNRSVLSYCPFKVKEKDLEDIGEKFRSAGYKVVLEEDPDTGYDRSFYRIRISW